MGVSTMKSILKTLFLCAVALVLAAFSATVAFAADPYDGVNRIGTYYQQSRSAQFSYAYGGGYYDYAYPARAGGWYGSSTEWITGLRAPVWGNVPPVRYTNFYQPTCGWPCWTGANGYPRATASQFPQRTRMGGIYGY